MILTDREAPRALREAAREYASQCQWVSDLKKAQERERDKFLAKEDSFLRAAEKRAVLEARLPEQYRTSYLEYCRTLDVGMKRQEQRLAERRAEYKAEQRKIGVKTPTLDTYPLEVPAPRSLRASAESYRDQQKQLNQYRIFDENERHGFLMRAIAGDPDPSKPPSETVLRDILPRLLSIDSDQSLKRGGPSRE